MTDSSTRLLRNVLIGAVVGVLIGLLLGLAFDGRYADNPFWAMAAGIFFAALFTSASIARRE